MKRGYIFCHGQKHDQIENFYLNQNVRWLTIDKLEDNDPDIIGDVFTSNGFSNIGKADMALTYFCPVGFGPSGLLEILMSRDFEEAKLISRDPPGIEMYNIMKTASFVLRKDGVFYFKTLINKIMRIYVNDLILNDGVKYFPPPNEHVMRFTMGNETFDFEINEIDHPYQSGLIMRKIKSLYGKSIHITGFINNYLNVLSTHGGFSSINTYEDMDGLQFCFVM